MAVLPYLKFFPADYLRDTEILSLETQGAWMRVLCTMWHPDRRGVLALPLETLAHLFRKSNKAARKIIDEIERCNVADVLWDDGIPVITCRRMVKDWAEATGEKKVLSDAGKAGAEKRWGNRKGGPPDGGANGVANSPPISPPNGKAESRRQNLEERRKRVPRSSDSLPPDLEVRVQEIELELGRLWTTAPSHMPAKERDALIEALPVFLEFDPTDWRASTAWISATVEQRGRTLWPRDRGEFIRNVVEAITVIRQWWKDRGRRTFEPLLARIDPPPPPVEQTPEEKAEMLREMEEFRKRLEGPTRATA